MKPATSYSWKEDCRKIYHAKRYPIEWQGADPKTYERLIYVAGLEVIACLIRIFQDHYDPFLLLKKVSSLG